MNWIEIPEYSREEKKSDRMHFHLTALRYLKVRMIWDTYLVIILEDKLMKFCLWKIGSFWAFWFGMKSGRYDAWANFILFWQSLDA